MSVDTTPTDVPIARPRARRSGAPTKSEAPHPAVDQPVVPRSVPRPRRPAGATSTKAAKVARADKVATAVNVVVVDAVGDSAVRHGCGAMVTPLFSVGGPTSCPLCHETV